LDPLRHQLQESGSSDQSLKTRPLIDTKGPHQHTEPRRMWEQREDRLPEQSIAQRTWGVALELRADGLDQGAVSHAGRAGWNACHAAEARIEMLEVRLREGGPAFEPHPGEINPAARRIHLLAPQHVGWTRRQAEPTVHAVIDELARRGMVLVENP
jgi:hypothetical protein